MSPTSASPGQPFYLRVEGVNLASFVFDTRDLSTIRGGGLALLRAVEYVRSELEAAPGVLQGSCKPLSEGASVGLFGFDASTLSDAQRARAHVEAALRRLAHEGSNPPPYAHATFVVDVLPADAVLERSDSETSKHTEEQGSRHDSSEAGSSKPTDAEQEQAQFIRAHEALIALNRFRQMQSSSLTVPIASSATRVCDLDGVRPGDQRGTPRTSWSSSVSARSNYGRSEKQLFYKRQLESSVSSLQLEHDFASELKEIARRNCCDPDRFLDGKMAVFYADGNSFGRHQQRLCTSPQRQRAWDQYLRDKRNQLLRRLLAEEVAAKDEWVSNVGAADRGCYRFETLLWGGDEVLFVVPAWLGFRLARFFFEEVADWNARDALDDVGQPVGFGDTRLTHSAAIVFCHYRAPIHHIKHLAKDQLTEFAKNKGSRERNQLVYQVLESFDHLGPNLEQAWRQRLGQIAHATSDHSEGTPNFDAADRVLSRLVLSDASPISSADPSLGARLQQIADAVDDLRRSEFPRSQLRQLVNDIVRGNAQDTSLRACLPRFLKVGSTAERTCRKATLSKLANVLGDDWAVWWHLEELWDYARP